MPHRPRAQGRHPADHLSSACSARSVGGEARQRLLIASRVTWLVHSICQQRPQVDMLTREGSANIRATRSAELRHQQPGARGSSPRRRQAVPSRASRHPTTAPPEQQPARSGVKDGSDDSYYEGAISLHHGAASSDGHCPSEDSVQEGPDVCDGSKRAGGRAGGQVEQ